MTTARPAVARTACGLLAVLTCGAPALATTYDVGPGDFIGDALAVAVAGDSVVVACGVYQEQGLVVPDGVVLRSVDGDPACVTVATTGGDPILTCSGGGPGTRIEGLTFTVAAGGWSASVARGAGLFCDGAFPEVSQCRFTDLEADYGGAVYCRGVSQPSFWACEFTGNLARAVGGAVNCVDGTQPLFTACLFADNALAAGGAAGSTVNASGGAQVRLESCTVVGAGAGGALAGFDAGDTFVSFSIVADGSGAAWFGDARSVPAFACTDIWNNATDWSGALADQAAVDGNLSADPIFCGTVAPDRPWHLDVSSPCAPDHAAGCGLIGAFEVLCNGSVGNDDPPEEPVPPHVPAETRLRGNRPNPFNPSTEIAFDLHKAGPVVVSIYDLAGRLVAQPLTETLPAGGHTVIWNGVDRQGRGAPAGVYLVQLRTGLMTDTARIALVK